MESMHLLEEEVILRVIVGIFPLVPMIGKTGWVKQLIKRIGSLGVVRMFRAVVGKRWILGKKGRSTNFLRLAVRSFGWKGVKNL